MPDDRRCERCDIPHSESEAAGNNGGIGWFVDGVCIVCIDWREQRQLDALERLAEWRRDRTDSEQANLRAFADD